ncbi:MAG: cupin domain-containing protein [Gammaproteobacteria bacterium]|nr:cupin domain-containing protein [Gammaproteobacteria bacterium]MYF67227.1 cupin domain-containing protein [Gammaproteobacteria bacterium]MYK36660.1 cupin domain-containing protein [Gammaproteobacteria bacterium]
MNERYNEPWWAVIGPEEGESIWQPLPSRGYIDLKLTPDNSPYDGFSVGTQLLPPGCQVREHGHRRNHELIFIHKGSGRVEIEGNDYEVSVGSTVLFGRYARHIIENTGDEDMELFWVFLPPGLEHWFRGIGRKRRRGEPMPDAFPRPEGVEELMEWMRFVPPANRNALGED